MDGLRTFCYAPFMTGESVSNVSLSSFQWWVGGDFEMCFQYLAFSTVSAALFGVTSLFYAGLYRSRYRRVRRPLIVIAKLAIAACLAANDLVGLVAAFWMNRQRPYAVLVAEVVNCVSWTSHAAAVWVFSSSLKYTGRGPLLLNSCWYLTLVASILHFRSTIRWSLNSSAYEYMDSPDIYFSLLSRVTVYIHMGLQVLYGVSFVFSVHRTKQAVGSHGRVGVTERAVSIQNGDISEGEDEEEVREKQPLLIQAREYGPTYGTVTVPTGDDALKHMNAYEDRANLLSLFLFWWVWPLLRRGAMGHLETAADLPPLPKSLQTHLVREKFRNVLLRRGKRSGSGATDLGSGGTSDQHVQERQGSGTQTGDMLDSEVMLKSVARSTPLPAPTPVPENSDDGADIRPVKSADGVSSQSTSPRDVRKSSPLLFLFSAINSAFGWHYYPLGLLKLTTDLLGFSGPLLLYQLVSFIENKKEPMYYGYLFALGLVLSTLVSAMLTSHFNYQVNKVGLKVRAALITEVYRKSLSISLATMSRYSTGQVVNFMSTDTDRIVNFCQSFHQFWSLPFQIIISLYLLYRQVGLAFLAGVAFCILLVPVNRWLAVKIGQLSTRMMAEKDHRVKVISEVLTGIRVIKFYAWEKHFSSKIFKLRQRELKSLRGRKYLDALCVYFWATTPVLISILTFTTYVALGHHLTAANVFTSVALFNILISPLNAFPWVINGLMEAWVSVKRVQLFLQLEEIDWDHYYSVDYQNSSTEEDQKGRALWSVGGGNAAVSVNDATFTWRDGKQGDGGPKDEAKDKTERDKKETAISSALCILSSVNLTVRRGRLVGVTGRVGSGKSSLLAAITAEMTRLHGQVFVDNLDDGFGLVTQEAWIQQATVRSNILFGLEMKTAFYLQVVAACALEEDFRILPAGDETEVGENGVTLSGGQKTRISLARAVYQDKAVYLLDDPLATVDAHVAAHLYTHCIVGLLGHKTRILCTHHHRFLRDADWVVVMEGGRVDEAHSGPPDTVLPWLEQQQQSHTVVGEQSASGERSGSGDISEGEGERPLDSTVELCGAAEPGGGDSREHALVQEEEKEVGVVALSVYVTYWASVGSLLAPAIFIALFLMQASKNVSDWWLAYWISHSHDNPGTNVTTSSLELSHTLSLTPVVAGMDQVLNATVLREAADSLEFYLGVYGGLAGANSVFTLFRAFLYAYGGVCAAKVLHKKLLRSILRAPTAFFDVTPIGRIVNRFSSDIYSIDDSLPFIMNILLAQVYGLLGTLAVTCYGLPWFSLLLVPLAVLYYYIQRFYRRTSRELKRLSSVTLSPVYAHFSETLAGLWTIRALRATQRFILQNQSRLDVNQRANYGSYAVAQWLGLCLQLLGVGMVAGVSFLAVLEHHFSTVDPGLVGLAISYALSVTGLLSGVVTSFTETEKQMVSVERAMQYITGAPAERDPGHTQPPPDWPSAGRVEFQNVTLSYRDDHPLALDNVSFLAKPGDKIGVVGRTGAGKSSLLQALFRMVDISGGCITIDGVDTCSLPLERLRSVMAVIPQDPFLFSGTLRENLDPCNQHSDHELWSALERCHLHTTVSDMGGLQLEVEERGRLFSVGQRQLVCLARALLRRSKVICIDEATANVDLRTDAHIQSTISQEFKDSTVLTIAHRIKTVLGCDQVLVMDRGRVREYGSPSLLLQQSDSLFLALYNEHTR